MKLARTKEWREARGLTQRELAVGAGVGSVTVPRIERGESVTPPTARKIAEALGVDIVDLMEDPPASVSGAFVMGKAEAPSAGPADTSEPSLEEQERIARQRIEASPRAQQLRNFRERIEGLSTEELRKVKEEEFAVYARLYREWLAASEEDPTSEKTAMLASQVDMAHAFAFAASLRLHIVEDPNARFVPVEAEVQREIAELVAV